MVEIVIGSYLLGILTVVILMGLASGILQLIPWAIWARLTRK